MLVCTGISRLCLPVRLPRSEDNNLRPFAEPEAAPPLRVKILQPEHHNWRVTRDLAEDISKLEVVNDQGVKYIKDIDLAIGRSAKEWYTYQGDDFNSVKGETLCERSFCRGAWSIRTVTRTVLTSTKRTFNLRAELDAYEGDKRIYSENWDHVIPRDLV